MEGSHYVLRCTSCGRQHDESRYGFALFCSCADPAAGLLRAEYTERRFVVNGGQGLFRYGHWLPIRSPHEPYPAATGVPAGPVAYRSSGLARPFQAVGSGTGAIAAWEMARRLVADGRFGGSVPHLHLAQNAPFTIMADAWEAGSRTLAPLAPTLAKRRIAAMRATVLSNRRLPYSLAGGVFDALSASAGSMYRVHNAAAERAAALFAETEGSDLDPAAAVAVAALRQAVAAGAVRRRDRVFLNVTGGGFQRLRAEGRARRLLPDLVVDHRSATPAALAELLAGARGAAALGSSVPYASALPPAGQAGGRSHAGGEIA